MMRGTGDGGTVPRGAVRTVTTGLLMGAADVVPGFSGGTVALVMGVYPRLVGVFRDGAGAVAALVRGRPREALARLTGIEWGFLLLLLAGAGTSILTIARVIEGALERTPVLMSATFLGLVLGAAVAALPQIRGPARPHVPVIVVAAALTAFGLGVRPADAVDPSVVMLVVSGAVAACAFILPGVSGAFLLLLLGVYPAAIAAVNDRDLVTVGLLLVGAGVGLGAFSTLLDWLLRRAHDVMLAVLVGLMVGSARVLWPWPSASGVGDPTLGAPGPDWPLALGLTAGAALAVVAVARVSASRTLGADGR